jgi:tRNA 2-thiouridine synthesizing protein A
VTTVDARGLRCPAPVIALARAITDVLVGDEVAVLADDPAAATDVPAWCRMRGHEYLGAQALDRGTQYLVRRSS